MLIGPDAAKLSAYQREQAGRVETLGERAPQPIAEEGRVVLEETERLISDLDNVDLDALEAATRRIEQFTSDECGEDS